VWHNLVANRDGCGRMKPRDNRKNPLLSKARVVEMVDTQDLKSRLDLLASGLVYNHQSTGILYQLSTDG